MPSYILNAVSQPMLQRAEYAVCQKGSVMANMWRDNKYVTMLSTMTPHSPTYLPHWGYATENPATESEGAEGTE